MDSIYELTNGPAQYEVRFDLGFGSERAYAVYDSFKIAPAKQKFKLSIGTYSGTAGTSIACFSVRESSSKKQKEKGKYKEQQTCRNTCQKAALGFSKAYRYSSAHTAGG